MSRNNKRANRARRRASRRNQELWTVDFETCEAMALGTAVHQQIESIREANRRHCRRGDEPAVFVSLGDHFHGTCNVPSEGVYDIGAITRAFNEMYRALQPLRLPPDFSYFDRAGQLMVGDYKNGYSIAPGDESVQLRVYREAAENKD